MITAAEGPNISDHLTPFSKIQVRRALSQGWEDTALPSKHSAQQVLLHSVEESSTLCWGTAWGHRLGHGPCSPLQLFISNSPATPTAEGPLDLMKSALRPSTTGSAIPFKPPATQSVLQICYKNHFIQHRYAELSRVESGSCSTHSLTETSLTISICFAIVTVMLTVKMPEILVCFSETIL